MNAPATTGPRWAFLTIWTYSSMMAPEGLGPDLKLRFEKKCACPVTMETLGDSGQLLARVLMGLERGRVPEVVLGIDHFQWKLRNPALDAAVQRWPDVQRKKRQNLIPVAAETEDGFWPFDWGPLAWLEKTDGANRSRRKIKATDLITPEFEKKLLLSDPRTSTPGWVWVRFTEIMIGDQAGAYWKAFRHQWRALPATWDDAYALFLKGEAPFVWSYVTSEAYHVSVGQKEYRYVEMLEGHPYQVEGALILKKDPQAFAFVEFLQSDEVQARIPKKQWMLPVAKRVRLEEPFVSLQKIRTVDLSVRRDEPSTLSRWSQWVRD